MKFEIFPTVTRLRQITINYRHPMKSIRKECGIEYNIKGAVF